MTILWESFSFLSTPFVRLSTRPKFHRYVIAITVFTLFFVQCISHNSTVDKPNDNNVVNDNDVVATHKKWLNENHANRVAASPMASDARVAISKRQSPTKISNSSSISRMSSRSHRSTDTPTRLFTHNEASSHSSSSNSSRSSSSSHQTTTSPPFATTKIAATTTTTTKRRATKERRQQPSSSSSPAPTNTVLILIQTHKNIELNRVRDQFHQFSDVFGVQLANITIDFDAIDGK